MSHRKNPLHTLVSGGPGTRNMVKTALERGFPVKTVDEAGKIHTLRPKAKAG